MKPDELLVIAPSLPGYALYPTALILSVVLMVVLWRLHSVKAAFLIFAVWSRYMLDAFPAITYPTFVSGLSINALAMAAVVAGGLVLFRKRLFLHPFFIPAYVYFAVIVLSGVVNAEIPDTIGTLLKCGYLMVTAVGLVEALEAVGENRLMPNLAWAFAPPIVFQILSVVLHVSKATEGDGSVSYIGGYNHESLFSVILATCFVVAALARSLRAPVRVGLLVAALVGIFLANYRTTILAIVPLAAVQFTTLVTRRFVPSQRAAVGVVMSIVVAIFLMIGAWIFQDRFHDLVVALSSGADVVKSPTAFDTGDRMLMNGRFYIWATYIDGYANSTAIQHVIGIGPNSWMGVYPHYAHSTPVSSLYEYGVVGIIALLYFWFAMLAASLSVRGEQRTQLVATHVSFILLNLATMPMWQVEGNILYGLLCGYTLFRLGQQSRSAPGRAAPQPRRWQDRGAAAPFPASSMRPPGATG